LSANAGDTKLPKWREGRFVTGGGGKTESYRKTNTKECRRGLEKRNSFCESGNKGKKGTISPVGNRLKGGRKNPIFGGDGCVGKEGGEGAGRRPSFRSGGLRIDSAN